MKGEYSDPRKHRLEHERAAGVFFSLPRPRCREKVHRRPDETTRPRRKAPVSPRPPGRARSTKPARCTPQIRQEGSWQLPDLAAWALEPLDGACPREPGPNGRNLIDMSRRFLDSQLLSPRVAFGRSWCWEMGGACSRALCLPRSVAAARGPALPAIRRPSARPVVPVGPAGPFLPAPPGPRLFIAASTCSGLIALGTGAALCFTDPWCEFPARHLPWGFRGIGTARSPSTLKRRRSSPFLGACRGQVAGAAALSEPEPACRQSGRLLKPCAKDRTAFDRRRRGRGDSQSLTVSARRPAARCRPGNGVPVDRQRLAGRWQWRSTSRWSTGESMLRCRSGSGDRLIRRDRERQRRA